MFRSRACSPIGLVVDAMQRPSGGLIDEGFTRFLDAEMAIYGAVVCLSEREISPRLGPGLQRQMSACLSLPLPWASPMGLGAVPSRGKVIQ